MMSSLSDERKSEITLANITHSDCGVVACQAVTGLSRREAERLCTEAADYKYGVGISRGALNRALQSIGCKLTNMRLQHNDTVATFSLRNEYGKYLIYTDGHVCSLVEGDLRNMRGGWHAPVEEAWRVDLS